MTPTQRDMNDCYSLAASDTFEDAPKAVRDALPCLAMKMDDAEDEIDAVSALVKSDLTWFGISVREDLAKLRAARDAFNAAMISLVERLERHYRPERDAPDDGGDRAYDTAKDAGEI